VTAGRRLVRSPTVLWRRTAFGVVVRTVEGPVVALEGSGAALWDRLEQPATPAELADALAARYDAPVEVVADDIAPVLDDLVAKRILESA
jgi:hypothetical protein